MLKRVLKNIKLNKTHITYEQLLEIISWNIFSMKMKRNSVRDDRLNNIKKIEGADYGGIYVGSPGRDIYHMLPYLSNDQMKEVADKVSEKFPKIPPKTYVNVAAFIRFLYGQFEKQGALRSKKDFERMKKEKLEWSLSRVFLRLLIEKLKKHNNYYGLCMLSEMEAHRLGDEAVINKNGNKLKEMEKMYLKTIKYADKCNSYKHMFSMYYWASKYFAKFGDVQKSVVYAKLSIKNASKYYRKYFPTGERYYSERLKNSFLYIEKNDKDDRINFKNKYKKCIYSKFK